MTRVAMGGTFDAIHRGHRTLLQTAFRAGDEGVFIGLTSDEMAGRHRGRNVRPYAERLATLTALLDREGWLPRAEIGEITTPEGRALEPGFDAIAVTEETEPAAHRINDARAARSLPPLAVLVAPMVLAEDGRRISATRIRTGEIDPEGRLLRALRVAVGSMNPVKVEAVRRVVSRYWPKVEVRGFSVDSTVGEQPFGDDTWKGAGARAKGALAAWPGSDFGVGVEAGLFWIGYVNDHFDVQCCVVVDRAGRRTSGQGPGFAYPPGVAERIRREDTTVGEVISDLSGVPDIGRKIGAVGFLTRGALDRTTLTEEAVLSATIPRIRPDLYLEPSAAPPREIDE